MARHARGCSQPGRRAAALPSERPAKLTFQVRVFRCFPSLHPTQPALGESPCIPPTAQVAELDRGDTCAIKFPGAPRRYFTRNRVKGPKFSGATRRNPANGAKRPQIFRRYAPGDPPPDFPTHIKYVPPALFFHGEARPVVNPSSRRASRWPRMARRRRPPCPSCASRACAAPCARG